MYAFKVDKTSRALFLNNTTQINDPVVVRTVELYLDDAGKFHVDWKHQQYEFKTHQIQNMEDWHILGTTKEGYTMVPIASVVNWPEPESNESKGE